MSVTPPSPAASEATHSSPPPEAPAPAHAEEKLAGEVTGRKRIKQLYDEENGDLGQYYGVVHHTNAVLVRLGARREAAIRQAEDLIRKGDVEGLKTMRSSGDLWSEQDWDDLVAETPALQDAAVRYFPWCGKLTETAIIAGELEVLRWLRGQPTPCPWTSFDGALYNAVISGRASCLALILASAPGQAYAVGVRERAAALGFMDALAQLQRHSAVPWRDECVSAAAGGHTDALKWLRARGCPWREAVCQAAADAKHVGTLQWLRTGDDPCPWDRISCLKELSGVDVESNEWLKTQLDEIAAEVVDGIREKLLVHDEDGKSVDGEDTE